MKEAVYVDIRVLVTEDEMFVVGCHSCESDQTSTVPKGQGTHYAQVSTLFIMDHLKSCGRRTRVGE